MKHPSSPLEKLVALLTAFALFATSTLTFFGLSEEAEALDVLEEDEELRDLVAILVTEEVAGNGDLFGKVERYASDLAENNALTDTEIIHVAEDDGVLEIEDALRRLYFEENLVGAVFVGDVPLPVVNKNGNRFVSMLPFTDFVEPTYVLDENGDFVPNLESKLAMAEIWHGVIRHNDVAVLSAFFDKNHAFYEGDPEFADFEKKMFFGDLANEEKQLNEDFFGRYLEYLASAEDLAYMRYNKYWARDLMRRFGGAEDLTDFEQLPDIQSKDLIDQQLFAYYKLFSRYNADVNDFVENTGRYEAEDADSVVGLITIKDEFTKSYLKDANEALEKQVDAVSELVAERIPLVYAAQIQVNGGPVLDWRFNFYNDFTNEYFVNGVDSRQLENVQQCSVFMGSTENEYYNEELVFDPKIVDGEYSMVTRATRTDDVFSAMPEVTTGLNSRIISPSDLSLFTLGAYGGNGDDTGALIEAAKIDNPLHDDFRSSLMEVLQPGDVVVAVNGKRLGALYSFDNAISDTFASAKAVLMGENFNETVLPWRLFDLNGELVRRENIGAMERLVVYFKIDFYRANRLISRTFSFSMDNNRGDTFLSRRAANSHILTFGVEGFPANFQFGQLSEGVLFHLFKNNNAGYGNRSYDASAGCNFGMTNQNSDLCIGKFAKMPVLEPAGSVAPEVVDGELAFAHRQSSEGAAVKEFDLANLEAVDEYHLNSCFSGLPSKASGFQPSYGFPLNLNIPFMEAAPEELDLYGQLYNQVRGFVNNRAGQFNPNVVAAEALWAGVGNLSADEIFLNEAKTISLGDFARAEGLDVNDLAAIGREFFTKEQDIIIEDEGLSLRVVPRVYNDQSLSTVIKHKEPTDKTIMAQLSGGVTESLPIDNPRYVAFLAEDSEIYRFDYPNLFEVDSLLDLRENLMALARDIAAVPGSYKVFGDGVIEGQFSEEEVANKIFSAYFSPVISALSDEESADRSLNKLAALKVQDALNWQDLDLNAKHEYVLKNYLNDDGNRNAFVADNTVFPAGFGGETKKGYEIAYLVLNGDTRTVDLNFNRDVEEEAELDPLRQLEERLAAGEVEGDGTRFVAADEVGGLEDGEFVWLDQFFEELEVFVDGFTSVPEFVPMCVFAEEYSGDPNEAARLKVEVGGELVFPGEASSLEVRADSQFLVSGRATKKQVTVDLRDEDGNLAAGEFYQLMVLPDQEVVVDPQADVNTNLAGVQLATLDGQASFEIAHSGRDADGRSSLRVITYDYALEEVLRTTGSLNGVNLDNYLVERMNFDVVADASIDFVLLNEDLSPKRVVYADGEVTKINLEVKNGRENLAYNGPIELELLSEGLGDFQGVVPTTMVNGEMSVNFIAARNAGEVRILVRLPGLVEQEISFETIGKVPARLVLTSSSDYLDGDNGEVDITLRLEDEFGNLVKEGNYAVALEGGAGVRIEPARVVILNGEATVKVRGNARETAGGVVRIEARAAALGLAGELALPVRAVMGRADFREVAPRAQIVALLGGDFGAISNGETLAQTVLFNGQTQAVVSTTVSGEQAAALVEVASDGELTSIDPRISVRAEGEKMVAYDAETRANILEVTVVGNGRQIFFSPPDANNPGIYLNLLNGNRFELITRYLGNSTTGARGLMVIDREKTLSAEKKAGFGNLSFEDAGTNFGLGFEGENKFMLLLAGGNSLGEAVQYSPSEAGIVLGDPLTRLENESEMFGEDVGMPIFSGDEQIRELIKMDFDGDGREDVLAADASGDVHFLKNFENRRNFVYRGVVLSSFSEIYSLAPLDVNGDGREDLVVATAEGCRADEQCLSVYVNNGGGFEREVLALDLGKTKVYKVAGGDLNNDRCDDLVLTDENGELRIYFNEDCDGLEKTASVRENFGVSLDGEENISGEIFVSFNGVAAEDVLFEMALAGGDLSAEQQAALALQNEILNDEDFSTATVQPVEARRNYGFAPFESVDGLVVRKEAIDVNGDQLAIGDRVKFVVELENESAVNYGEILVSDSTPSAFSLDEDSLRCLDNGCGELYFEETGVNLRGQVVRGLSLEAFTTSRFEYEMTVNFLPQVDFVLGNDLTNYPSNNGDGLLDILVKTNVDGAAIYLYSREELADGTIAYGKFVEEPEELVAESTPTVFGATAEGDPSAAALAEMNRILREQNADKDFDGCSDFWGDFVGENESRESALASRIRNGLSRLRCDGAGCAPTPYNKAFFVPDGAVRGFAPLAIYDGAPWVAPSSSSNGSTFIRFYLSPTLSLGLGTAICYGPGTPTHSASLCFVAARPGGIPGICEEVEEAFSGVKQALRQGNAVSISPDAGMASVISDGTGQEDARTVALGGNFGEGNDFVSGAAAVNIKVPGFPSVITNWLDAQTDEIYNKLLDFPKLYVVMPDLVPFVRDNLEGVSGTSFQSFNDFARSISAIPLINIESKEIVVRVPAISAEEIEKYRYQWQYFKEEMTRQLEDRLAIWNCDANVGRRALCDKITIDINNMIDGVDDLLAFLDRLANIPREILNYRYLESKYATQLVCYMDAVINHTGGYIKRQQRIIESWIQAGEDAVRAFSDWRVILDVMLEYQQSCDQCKNHRFGKLGILLESFIQIPEPPVIPLPKWPDVVVDLSNIETGVDILWPDVVFRPEPIQLPDIPVIYLPEVLPNIDIDLPDLDLNFALLADLPSFSIPQLPDLPPLPLPQLPDLPRPPRMPRIPNVLVEFAADMREVFRVICLLTNGLLPVPEFGLATEIETLTQPSVIVSLPILKNFGVKIAPVEVTYLKEIRVETKARYQIDTLGIYGETKGFFGEWNKDVREASDFLNTFTTLPYGNALSNLLQQAVDEAAADVEGALDDVPVPDVPGVDVDVDLQTYNAELEEILSGYEDGILALENLAAEMESVANVEQYVLEGEERFLAANDPLLNRSLDEVKLAISGENLPENESLRQLAQARDGLIAYVEAAESRTKGLEGLKNYDDFVSKIALDVEGPKFAAQEFNGLATSDEVEVSLLGAAMEEEILAEARAGELIANNVESPEQLAAEYEEVAATGGVKGFFVAGENGSVKVLAYEDELAGARTLFIDGDGDDDEDLVYSMGGDIYLKVNQQRENNLDNGDFVGERDLNDIAGEMVAPVNFALEGDNLVVQDALAGRYFVEIREGFGGDGETRELIGGELSLADLEEGIYLLSVVFEGADGRRSLVGRHELYRKDDCGDRELPMPVVSSSEYRVGIFAPLKIDASNSFDAQGEVVEMLLSVRPTVNNGLRRTQLPPLILADANGVFTVGPFVNEGDIGLWQGILTVKDGAGNVAKQELEIEVFTPEVRLTEVDKLNGEVFGEVEPLAEDVPVQLMRRRLLPRSIDGEIALVTEIEEIGETLSDVNGNFRLGGLEVSDDLVVRNAAGEIVAEVNAANGNIAVVDGYEVRVEAAEAPDKGTRLILVDENNVEMLAVVLRFDPNNDVVIGEAESGSIKIIDRNAEDGLGAIKIKANSLRNPGGALLADLESNEELATVDTFGNVLLYGRRVSLEKLANRLTEPVSILVNVDGDLAFEIVLNPTSGSRKLRGESEMPIEVIRKGSFQSLFDGNGSLASLSKKLVRLAENFGAVDEVDRLVTRKEFTKIVLEMLCIVPREEAFEPFAAGEGYYDVAAESEYYPYIREATFLGLVEGYGEPNAEGLNPFRPDGLITRAEATKIILEALEYKEVISLDELAVSSPWYNTYLEGALNLNSLSEGGEILKSDFLLTVEEAAEPNENLMLFELRDLAERVLDIYDCMEIDEDADGLSDYCQATYGIRGGLEDEDADGLVNQLECELGLDPTLNDAADSDNDGLEDLEEIYLYFTDPNDLDTDDGGIGDGAEVDLGKNPLNGVDDFGGAGAGDEAEFFEEGVFIIPPECDTCPCQSTLTGKGDIMTGDVLFPTISVEYDDHSHVFAKGNEIIINRE